MSNFYQQFQRTAEAIAIIIIIIIIIIMFALGTYDPEGV